MEQPPNSILDKLDKSFDSSINLYFDILRWNFCLMFMFSLLQIPNLLFCTSGNSIYGSFHMSIETFTTANIAIDSSFLTVVLCDCAAGLVYLAGIGYLRYSKSKDDLQNRVSSISPWSVVVSGFPSATIDPDDLRTLIVAGMHEIYLVRNFRGTLGFMKQKASLERQIRIESKKLEIHSPKLTQAEIYIRQDYIRVLKEDLQGKVKELSERFNLFLAPDDLESIRAFAVFKSKVDRDYFYDRYNPDWLVKHGYRCCYTQPSDLMLRNLYEIRVREAPDPSEIKWENMDYVDNEKTQFRIVQILIGCGLVIPLIVFDMLLSKQAMKDPQDCGDGGDDCLRSSSSSGRLLIQVLIGFWVICGNEISMLLLNRVLLRERQIYLVTEQYSILKRFTIYLFIHTFLILLVLSQEYIGGIIFSIIGSAGTTDLIYSDNIDRKWVQNHGCIFIWISIMNTLLNIIISLAVRCYSGGIQDLDELQLISSIINEENQEERQRLQVKTQNQSVTNQSHQTLFLLNLDDNNINNYSQQHLDIRNAKPLRKDSQIINNNTTFQTGERYARLIFAIALATIFSSACPILPFLGTIHIGLQYCYDKYLLLNYYSYNEQQQIKLQTQLSQIGINTLKFIPIIMILHWIISLLIYGHPSMFNQTGLGMAMQWDEYSFKQMYMLGTNLPITISIILLILSIIAEYIYMMFSKSTITSEQVSEDYSSNIDDYLPQLKEQGAMISYNLKYHDEYKEIITSQKNESIRATLNQFKH